ncbi:MAG: hypothetical protein ACOYMA_07205 [Bacteroidia bacterium]
MKKIIVILIILGTINKVSAKNDSLLVCNDSIIIKHCVNPIYDSLIVDNSSGEINLKTNKISNKSIPKNKQSNIKSNNKPDGFGDFLVGLIDFISPLWKPVWGYYEEENMKKEGPYFMFNRMENNNINNK